MGTTGALDNMEEMKGIAAEGSVSRQAEGSVDTAGALDSPKEKMRINRG